jgi:hypothetical protein
MDLKLKRTRVIRGPVAGKLNPLGKAHHYQSHKGTVQSQLEQIH